MGTGFGQQILWSYAGVGISVLALVGVTMWWVYSKYKRKAK